ncbi:MAG: hypothetical protein WCF95_01595 [bacterium]
MNVTATGLSFGGDRTRIVRKGVKVATVKSNGELIKFEKGTQHAPSKNGIPCAYAGTTPPPTKIEHMIPQPTPKTEPKNFLLFHDGKSI